MPALVPLLLPATVLAGPVGEQVTAGTASVTRPDSVTTVINQQTQKAVIDWQSFSIAAQEQVNFQQPNTSSIALNRVIGNDLSAIYGTLTANGQVFLVNPNGVLFAPGSRVSVHGLLATTHDLSNDDFVAGRYIFSHHERLLSNGEVVNQGSLAAGEGGYIVLAGDYAANTGVIQARLGQVSLASGNRFTLDIDGDELIVLAVDAASLAQRAGVENLGTIGADGGRVVMTAQVAADLATTVVNNAGLIQARSIGEENGEIILRGGAAGVVANTGILDASGSDGANGGGIAISGDFVAMGGTVDASGVNGGAIVINANTLSLADTIVATGAAGLGGSVAIDVSGKSWETSTSVIDVSGVVGGSISHLAGEQITSSGTYLAQGYDGLGGDIALSSWAVKLLAAGFDASGTGGGGRIRIGGEWQGGKNLATDEIENAQTLAVNDSVSIIADGLGADAPGGEVVLWADQKAAVYADISAKPQGAGAGGTIEVSSGDTLTFGGTADAGVGGTVLFDPKNITIDEVAASTTLYSLILGYNYEGSPDGIRGSGLGVDDLFGQAVSLNAAGDLLAVGAPYDDGQDNGLLDSGAVYLFSFTDTDFGGGSLAGAIGYGYSGGNNVNVSTLGSSDFFGTAVSLNAAGDRLAVGAWSDDSVDNSVTDSGAVYLFSFTDTNFSGGNLAGTIGYGYTGGNDVNVTDLEAGDRFGTAVSLNGSGDRLAVGAIYDFGSGNSVIDSGAVYLFSFTDTNFSGGSLVGTMGYGYTGGNNVNVSALEAYDCFGSSLSLNSTGDRLAVGAMYDDGVDNSTVNIGGVYLFGFTDTSFGSGSLAGTMGYGYSGGNNVNVAGLDENDMFGSSVSLNGAGDRLAVGAMYDDGFGNSVSASGAAYLFSFDDTSFSGGSLAGTMGYGYTGGNNVNVSALEEGDYFGSAVSLNGAGDRLAVGTTGDDGFGNSSVASGAVHLFTFADTNFSGASLAGTIGFGFTGGNNVDISTLDASTYLGTSISLNGAGDRLAIGNRNDDGFDNSRSGSGAVYLFSFTDTNFSGGTLTGTIGYGYNGANDVDITNLEQDDAFGSSVSLNGAGDRLVVGAVGDAGFDNSRSYSGAAYLISFTDTNFSGGSLVGTMGYGYPGANDVNVSELETSDFFGSSVSINDFGNRLAVGAYRDDGFANNLADSGAVRLFSFSDANFNTGNLVGTIGYGYIGTNDVNVTTLGTTDMFGESISLNGGGDQLAVGTEFDDGFDNSRTDSGVAYLFSFADENFSGGSQTGTIGYGYSGGQSVNVATLESSDYFGASVSLNSNGDRLAVGAYGDDGFGNSLFNSGATYLFAWSAGDSLADNDAFAENPDASVTFTPATLTNVLNAGSNVILQANNDITVNSAVTTVGTGGAGTGGDLDMAAGRSILVNADINLDGGSLTLVADESEANGVILAYRDAGTATIDTEGVSLTAGAVSMTNNSGPIQVGNITAGAVSLTTPGAITIFGTVDNSGGTTTLDGAANLSGGILKNTTLSSIGATRTLSSSNGILDNVTIGSDLSILNHLFIRNGLTLGDGVTVSKNAYTWYFDGIGAAAGTVHHLASLGASTILNYGQGLALNADSANQVLQIDSGVTFQGYGNPYITNFYDYDCVNNGTIIANTAGQTLYFRPDTFTNNGTMKVTAGTLIIGKHQYDNNGGSWSNPGQIIVEGGTLNLFGTFSAADITGASHYTRTGGIVELSGVMDNTGNTLDIGSAGVFGPGGLYRLDGGTIKYGTLVNTDATPTLLSRSGRLDGVTIGSNLTVNYDDAYLYINHGLTLADGITVNKGVNTWVFDGYYPSEPAGTVHHLSTLGSSTLTSPGGSIMIMATSSQTLQIDSGVTVQGYGNMYEYWAAGSSIINAGAIDANTAGQTFSISPGIFTNSGTLNVTAGTMSVSSTTFNQFGTINVAEGTGFTRTAGFTSSGTLSGGGTITVGTGAAGLVNQGNINPGGTGSIGTLTVAGDLQFDTGSVLSIEMGGSAAGAFDRINVTGNITMSGALQAVLLADYTPLAADVFPFLIMGGTASGAFSSASLPADFNLSYNAAAGEAARLAYEPEPPTVTEPEPPSETEPEPAPVSAELDDSVIETVDTIQIVVAGDIAVSNEITQLDDGMLSSSQASEQPAASSEPNAETSNNGNDDDDEEGVAEGVSLASSTQDRPLAKQPIFDLAGGGVAGQNVVCK